MDSRSRLTMNKEIKICDECVSEYFANTSMMLKLCPDCSHYLYRYPNCKHNFRKGRCSKCYWNGKTSKYISNLKN